MVIKKHWNSIILLLLIAALFVTIYRTGTVLGFYFDQGRDAMAIWNLVHHRDFFLIGPTTGIAGIFRGPFYYYLIAPVYAISGGNPVWAANFLALISVIGYGLMYYLALKNHSKQAGLFAVVLAGFSYYMMMAARWLSNPTPMLLLSVLLIWSMLQVMKGKRIYWVLISLVAGLSLFHFGSSGEFFYFPAIAIFALWQRKHFPSKKILIWSVLAFLFTASPLILFDFRNGHILSNNIKQFLFEKDSFKSSFWDVVSQRIDFYWGVFISKIYPGTNRLSLFMATLLPLIFVFYIPKLIKNKLFVILSIFLLTVMIGLLFFQGNEGNIYDYYLTGYYMMFLLTVAIFLGELWKNPIGKLIVIVFLYSFLSINLPIVKSKIMDNADGPTTILLGNQMQAINWVYADANGAKFNTDFYVPPVIPHAYDYLFTWQDSKRGQWDQDSQIGLLYTLYEQDPPHPERLDAWKERQAGIGEVEYETSFGGITVQRRKRIK